MIKFIADSFYSGRFFTPGMVGEFGATAEATLISAGSAITMRVPRAVLQSGVRSHSDAVGTWTQSGTTITLSVTGHGAVPGDTWAFNPTAGTGILATAGIYTIQTTADANTMTLTSATSSTGTGTMLGTGAQVVYSGTIPGGCMGKNGSLKILARHRHTNSANNKTFEVFFGGYRFTQWTLTTSLTSGIMAWIPNLNSEQVQQRPTGQGAGMALGAGNFNNSGGDWENTTIDTAMDQLFQVKITKATGSELARLESLLVQVIPSLD